MTGLLRTAYSEYWPVIGLHDWPSNDSTVVDDVYELSS